MASCARLESSLRTPRQGRLMIFCITPAHHLFQLPSRRQVASLDRRIYTGTNPSRGSIMLRMVLLGLLIPLGVGVLAAMELRTQPRTEATDDQPLAQPPV